MRARLGGLPVGDGDQGAIHGRTVDEVGDRSADRPDRGREIDVDTGQGRTGVELASPRLGRVADARRGDGVQRGRGQVAEQVLPTVEGDRRVLLAAGRRHHLDELIRGRWVSVEADGPAEAGVTAAKADGDVVFDLSLRHGDEPVLLGEALLRRHQLVGLEPVGAGGRDVVEHEHPGAVGRDLAHRRHPYVALQLDERDDDIGGIGRQDGSAHGPGPAPDRDVERVGRLSRPELDRLGVVEGLRRRVPRLVEAGADGSQLVLAGDDRIEHVAAAAVGGDDPDGGAAVVGRIELDGDVGDRLRAGGALALDESAHRRRVGGGEGELLLLLVERVLDEGVVGVGLVDETAQAPGEHEAEHGQRGEEPEQ